MKSITQFLSGRTFLWIPLYFIYKKYKSRTLWVLLFITILGSGCYQHFYRTNTKQSASADMLQKLQNSSKFFVVHFPDRNIGLQNVSINQNNIEGDEILLPASHTEELNPRTTRSNAVKKSDKDSVLMEVHLYTKNTGTAKGRISLPISEINRMDVYEFDKNATSLNHTLSTVGVAVVGAFVLAAAIIVATCNCPQVYVEKDGASQFNGGMYSGAIYSTLERTDYMPLPLVRTIDNKLKLSVNNAPEEEQFINSLQLMQVTHTSEEKVLLDRHGKILTYKNPILAEAAYTGMQQNNSTLLNNIDGASYSFNNNQAGQTGDVLLTFKNPNQANKGKLVISAKNSAWSGFVFKEFNSLFGESTEKWRASQEKADPKKLELWQKNQALPIMVYIKEGGKWKFIDYFPLVGNTASRNMIMEFNIENNKSETIDIKLETVYRFWDIDYAGLDLTPSMPFSGELTDPDVAVSNNGTNQKSALLKTDEVYTELKDDDGVKVEFNLSQPPALGQVVSYFLVSRGYYHNLTKYNGKAKTLELLPFRNDGAFNTFSRNKYEKVNKDLAEYSVKNQMK